VIYVVRKHKTKRWPNPDSQVTIHMAASDKLDRDIALHLAKVKAHKSGMVELRYEVARTSQRLDENHLTNVYSERECVVQKNPPSAT
jgi:hypothetical protein